MNLKKNRLNKNKRLDYMPNRVCPPLPLSLSLPFLLLSPLSPPLSYFHSFHRSKIPNWFFILENPWGPDWQPVPKGAGRPHSWEPPHRVRSPLAPGWKTTCLAPLSQCFSLGSWQSYYFQSLYPYRQQVVNSTSDGMMASDVIWKRNGSWWRCCCHLRWAFLHFPTNFKRMFSVLCKFILL